MLDDIFNLIHNQIIGLNSDSNMPVYAFTNENINDLLTKLNLNSTNKVLTIAGSGDQFFNLATKGLSKIDLIDINPLSEYYILGFKLALIKMCDFEDITSIFDLLFKNRHFNFEEEIKILKILVLYMPFKYQEFWQKIIDYYYTLQSKYLKNIKLMQILTKDYYYNLEEITFYNTYLQSKESYQNLQAMLNYLKPTFYHASLYTTKLSTRYDLIFCSNILEYYYHQNMTLPDLKKLYAKLYPNLSPNGLILASYMYSFINNFHEYSNYPIGGKDITSRELLKEELLYVPSYHSNCKDAVLVLRP